MVLSCKSSIGSYVCLVAIIIERRVRGGFDLAGAAPDTVDRASSSVTVSDSRAPRAVTQGVVLVGPSGSAEHRVFC